MLKRERLAQRIETALSELTGCPVRNVVLRPTTGAWRTDVRLDVMRWEGAGEISFSKGARWIKFTVASWDTMTRLLRQGFVIVNDGRPLSWELHAKEPHEPVG